VLKTLKEPVKPELNSITKTLIMVGGGVLPELDFSISLVKTGISVMELMYVLQLKLQTMTLTADMYLLNVIP